MGTRSLTMVIDQEGNKKVAQYGQWDGYPGGVGAGVLSFIKDEDLFNKFKSKLNNIRFLEPEGRDKKFIENYNKNAPQWSNEPDKRTQEQKKWFENFITRDLAEQVLTNIANSEDEEIILTDNTQTATSGGWVEYSYVINLKENTLGVYGLIDQDPIKVYDINNLPEEDVFINEIENFEE